MVPVFILFPFLISSALMDDVHIHRNLTRKSSDLKSIKLLPSNLPHFYNIENEKPIPQTGSIIDIEQRPTKKCPNTDILLKILNIITKSLPKAMIEPQKFKDVISTIKNILAKASDNSDVHNLNNEVRTLEDQLEKINKADEEKVALRTQNDKKLKAKLSLQYDVPDKCEHILYGLVNFINNAYNQMSKYCLVTGNCKVDDLPHIKYDTARQTEQPFILDQLLQKQPINNPYLQGSGSQNTNPKYKTVYDLIKALQYYKSNLGSTDSQNYLSRLIPQDGNVNSNNLIYNVSNKSQNSLNGLYPEWMLPDSRAQQPSNNLLSMQDVYSALNKLSPNTDKNQDYLKILTEKLKAVDNSNKSKQNIEGTNNSDVLSILQSLGINVSPPSKIDKSGAENQLKETDKQTLYDSYSKIQQPSNNLMSIQDVYSSLNKLSPNTDKYQDYLKILTEKLKSVDNSNKSKQNIEGTPNPDVLNILQSLGINVSPPSKIDKSAAKNQSKDVQESLYDSHPKSPEQLNISDLYELLYSMKLQPDETGDKLLDIYSGSYVKPDTLNITPDKNKQYVQLPDLSQFSVTNQDKLNTMPNQNEVVELTYMLKRPKLAYEPLYYVKYRVPYYAFLYNLQKLLIKSPSLRNQPRKLYQELLMQSNITEAPGDLKNLQREELVKLVATNGTLLNAKIVSENKGQDEHEAQNSTVNIVSGPNKTTVDPLSIIEKFVQLASNNSLERNSAQQIGLNPYLRYSYPSYSKPLYQSGLNYKPGNLLSSRPSASIYGRPSVYSYNGVNKNIYPSNMASYSMYSSG